MNPLRKHLSFEQLEQRQLLAAVSIPTNLTGQAAEQVSTPVAIDTALGIRGASIHVKYDPSVLTLTQESVTAGTAWSSASDTQITSNVDQSTGTVVVFLSSSTDLPSTSGSLVNFRFSIRNAVSVGTISTIDLVEVRLNEGAIPVNPAPILGVDSTDGSITVTGTPGIPDGSAKLSGIVFADTNQDNLPSSLEGIPGVQVILVNVASGVSQQATTGSDGTYQFINLSPGNYRIVQTQPNAYIDGGQNQLNATLAANQVLANQNFRELGLRPEFIHNRLLTTLVMPIGSGNWLSSIAKITQLPIQRVSAPSLSQLANSTSRQNLASSPVSNAIPDISNHVLTSQLFSTSSIQVSTSSIQAEGEGTMHSGSSVVVSPSPATSWMPNATKRLRSLASMQHVDEAFASQLAFE